MPEPAETEPTVATEPPPAQPDDKDWTWVLSRPCADCGADVGALTVGEVARSNREVAAAWADVLDADEAWVRARPAPDVWSPLEYACHVRDVFRLFAERLDLMRREDDPEFANWDPNVTQVASRYHLADPTEVRAEILSAGIALADAFDALEAHELSRRGRRTDGAHFTIESFARYELHDPLHHLWDVTGRRHATADQSTPGQSTPGQSTPDQSTPGQST